MSASIRLHRMIMHTDALGPFSRCAIWLQGCFRECPGCMAPSTRPLDGGTLVPIDELLIQIKTVPDIEGITISGGEPFMQVDALHELLYRLRKETTLGVIIYSGYYIDELRGLNNSKIDAILDSLLDILIDGLYDERLNDGVALRGSSNQTVHFLTERYRPYKAMYETPSRKVEAYVNNDELFIVGVPDKASLERWRKLEDKY